MVTGQLVQSEGDKGLTFHHKATFRYQLPSSLKSILLIFRKTLTNPIKSSSAVQTFQFRHLHTSAWHTFSPHQVRLLVCRALHALIFLQL